MAEAVRELIAISSSKKARTLAAEMDRLRANYARAHETMAEDITFEAETRGRRRGIGEGWSQGKAEGKAETQRDFVQNLLADGFKLDKIAQLMGLSVGEVKEISLTHGTDHS